MSEKTKLNRILKSPKMWIYVVFFIITIIAISPSPFNSGVAIRSVEFNSSAYLAGISSPTANDAPASRLRIIAINDQKITDASEFDSLINSLPNNDSIVLTTENTKFGLLLNQGKTRIDYEFKEDIGIKVYNAPKSNILLGLDLQGGTRVVLEPETKLSKDDLDITVASMKQRLDVFGLTDTTIRSASDLEGNQFIVVEVAGANEDEVKELIASQGKFEAKIGNTTVFRGGKDVTFVCRTPQCSGIDPTVGCGQIPGGHSCRFVFSISLSQQAAQRQANATKDLSIVDAQQGQPGFLSQNLDLFLDDILVDSLRIGAQLRGSASTGIAISGSGFGASQKEAQNDALNQQKQLQTVLITGSLPTKLNIIKTDILSPSLGGAFLKNAIIIAILAELAVTIIVILRYRKFRIAIPIISVITSEILLILGIAALLKQNIDIAGIAGIIVAIGTGVDDQIVITDELISSDEDDARRFLSFAQRIKKAFFIVFAAYFATIAAMVPLLFAGAGLLKGFAITTIIGVTSGVFITRPAFAEMMEILLENDK